MLQIRARLQYRLCPYAIIACFDKTCTSIVSSGAHSVSVSRHYDAANRVARTSRRITPSLPAVGSGPMSKRPGKSELMNSFCLCRSGISGTRSILYPQLAHENDKGNPRYAGGKRRWPIVGTDVIVRNGWRRASKTCKVASCGCGIAFWVLLTTLFVAKNDNPGVVYSPYHIELWSAPQRRLAEMKYRCHLHQPRQIG